LNAKHNVTTIGYVRTDYCRRDVEDVFHDIEVYSGWPSATSHAGIHVKGIFFDETPNGWTEQVADYLDSITTRVKHDQGIQGARLVMHNPGTIPEKRTTQVKPDITAIFEASYTTFEDESVQERLSATANHDHYRRTSVSFIVHSTPIGEIKALVDELKLRAQYLFVTDLQERYYESFGAGWDVFVDAVASRSAVDADRL
jgi:hypothetical protein